MKGGEDIVFWLFVQLSIRSLTPFRAIYLYFVEEFPENLPQIFVA